MLHCRPDDRMYVTNIRAPSVVEGDMFQAYTMGKVVSGCVAVFRCAALVLFCSALAQVYTMGKV
jgi:hypothetical protein